MPSLISKEIGIVKSVRDYLIYLEGLPSVRINDVIVNGDGGRALVTSLDKEKVEAWMLDPQRPLPGDCFELTSRGINLPSDFDLFGRTINPLGAPLDGKGNFPQGEKPLDLDVVAPGIDSREIIKSQFYTGLTVVDTLVPIGEGQRELLFGEARSGKSSFLLDIIIHQKDRNWVCIYTAIGKSEIDVKRFSENIEKEGADKYTIIIAATSSDAAPLIALAPSVAFSIAEHYRNSGRKVLLILDDLATHSKYLREIYLLSGRIPGRESYPADIFYQHSRLVERAGSFTEKMGGGSITLLPVIETDMENFSTLIPTNVMSMTDGHLYFSASLRAQGYYPAIEPERSVSRAGRQTQMFIHKDLSDRIRSLLADYQEMEKYSRFGSELTPSTQTLIKRGKICQELLKQEPLEYIDPKIQILLLSLVFTAFFDNSDLDFVREHKKALITAFSREKTFQKIKQEINQVSLDILLEKLKENLPVLEAVCRTLPISKKI